VKKKRPEPRRIKINRSYTVDEVARVCEVHKHTVRRWIKNGLLTCDNRRPTLILGKDLRVYLEQKKTRNKKPLKPGEIYCVRCRDARNPAESFADIEVINNKIGNLSGFCPVCESIIYRRISFKKFQQVIGQLEVAIPEALKLLIQGDDPSQNSDFH